MRVGLYCGELRPDIEHRGYCHDLNEVEHLDILLDLPPEVSQSVRILQKNFGTKKKPVFHFDPQGHGPYGLATAYSVAETDNFGVVWSRTSARISFGPKSVPKVFAHKSAELGRLHLSVYGARMFFTKSEIAPVIEEAHVSLRWIDDAFDDWSNRKHWLRDSKIKHTPGKHYHTQRTTYFNTNRIIPSVFLGDGSGGTASSEQLNTMLEKRGTNSCRLDKGTRTFRSFLVEQDSSPELFSRMWSVQVDCFDKIAPTIGYKPVLKALAQFGDVTLPRTKSVAQLTPV
ncbi:MAG: hypothetical protein Q7K43_02120, partial [Candidatus Woesearchaeota archaeon]|nr:hypothetical protein [Candidatus Woesearchaeota archaeon]